jgi:hypothetical protein
VQAAAALCIPSSRGKPLPPGETDIPSLAGADDDQPAYLIEDEFGFRLRDDVRCSAMLLDSFFLRLGTPPQQSDDHVMIVCLAVDGDAAELTAIDARGLPSLRRAVVPSRRLLHAIAQPAKGIF